MTDAIEERFGANLGRVRDLSSLSDAIADLELFRETDLIADVLRAAVVLLHATLEDLLRSLAEVRLPLAKAEYFAPIPLFDSLTPRKLTLSDLAVHRGLSVSEVLSKSVEAHLDRSSYNHPGDVTSLLRSIDVPPELVVPHASELAAMMNRRHLIAHRTDRDDKGGSGAFRNRPIDIDAVERWTATVSAFGIDLFEYLRTGLMPSPGASS